MTRPLVYIAGPVTDRGHGSVEIQVARLVALVVTCVARGVPCVCPGLTGAFPSSWARCTDQQWLAADFAVIARCTHILMAPGWETSAGAKAEKAYAEQIGVRVVTTLEAIEALADDPAPAAPRERGHRWPELVAEALEAAERE